jgi:hypothetical protein
MELARGSMRRILTGNCTSNAVASDLWADSERLLVIYVSILRDLVLRDDGRGRRGSVGERGGYDLPLVQTRLS